MFEIILLFLIIGLFVFGTYKFQNKVYEDKETKTNDKDMVFIISMILLISSFVIGFLFSKKFIDFLMSFSKLTSIAIMLNNIKNFFIGKPKKEIMTGGGNFISQENDLYYDELPESDEEEEY